jgi:hypothetical protein
MTSMSELERGYRRLVACYPKSFRQENGEEIISVLMATASQGQRRPTLTESADLLKGAFRMRMGLSRAPMSVVRAVRLMCLGAVAELGTLIIAIATWGTIRASVIHHYPQYAVALTRAVNDELTSDLVILPVAAVVWVCVAYGVGRGSQWARVAAIVLAFLYTLGLGVDLSQGVFAFAPAAMIASCVVWAIGVAAIGFLLHKQSWPYFERGSAVPRQEVRL